MMRSLREKFTMGEMNWEKERNRLVQQYAEMADSELEKIAEEANDLTDVARAALRPEMLRRGLAVLPEARSPIPTAKNISPENSEARSPVQTTENIPSAPVVIRRYRDLLDASAAKSILDSAGIESFLSDENMVRMGWFYSDLFGGIKLLVREEDAESARKLLEQ
jgi:Putative prokaryotic signal transducing protein